MADKKPYVRILDEVYTFEEFVKPLFEEFAKKEKIAHCKIGGEVNLENLSGSLEQSQKHLLLDVRIPRQVGGSHKTHFIYSGACLVYDDLVVIELSGFCDMSKRERDFTAASKPEHLALRPGWVRYAYELMAEN